ncbi:hydroxyacid dehydrogenase [Levilactobacillus namurensis]|uniref:hydroxyacid dehydrogenase n=1 Tax=Levilactobacillus namurensis TaxID=380393 RepID=UPI000464B523|nr:hydroxyacid dehydrogenase [Levilactobacillus namurensis]
MKKVLMSEKIDDAGIKLLEDNGFTVTTSPATDKATMASEIKDAYAVIMRSSELPDDVISAGKNLKIISRNGTGINNVDVESATKHHVLVAKVNGANAFSVAEYALTSMLMLSRKIILDDKLVRGKKNELSTYGSLPNFSSQMGINGNELRGKTLAILGLGKIGRQLVKFAQAFEMNVIGYDPYVKDAPVKMYDHLEDIYPVADFISIHMPLTPETAGMIGEKELKAMKSNAILINSARGGIIDEVALAKALKSHEIAGAALDSFKPEPPAPDNPLFDVDNVIMTSHIAGTTAEANQALGVGAAQAIIDFSNGKMPEFPVNPDVFVAE